MLAVADFTPAGRSRHRSTLCWLVFSLVFSLPFAQGHAILQTLNSHRLTARRPVAGCVVLLARSRRFAVPRVSPREARKPSLLIRIGIFGGFRIDAVAPLWFETQTEIRSKIDTENCCTFRVQSWTGDRVEVHFEPPKLAVDESEIRNHGILSVQHFYIGTKIKPDPGSELGSIDLGSGEHFISISSQALNSNGATVLCVDLRSDLRPDLGSSFVPRWCNWPYESSGLKGSVSYNLQNQRDHGGEVVGLLASDLGEPVSIPGGIAPGFSQVGILPDNAAGGQIFSGISRFPRPCIPASLHTHLVYPHRLSSPRC
ncbi:hypothetical protein PR048_032422 [Dryococelus australis]|uniref:Uncharacterized protein n=1 Tax=Dryococelus australis TaxID=614101 RepID=A0ABQ9G5A5_9NEOP|nr:hypothetical protein PR048_032422 [Dryococelus australis]